MWEIWQEIALALLVSYLLWKRSQRTRQRVKGLPSERRWPGHGFDAATSITADQKPFSFQSTRLPRALQNFPRLGPRLGSAVAQDAVDVIQVGHQFGALLPRVGEIIPVVLEQRLLQISVAKAASAQT